MSPMPPRYDAGSEPRIGATAARYGVDDPRVTPNMPVWESLDAFKHFMHKTGHAS
jgi:hypothetical protein